MRKCSMISRGEGVGQNNGVMAEEGGIRENVMYETEVYVSNNAGEVVLLLVEFVKGANEYAVRKL